MDVFDILAETFKLPLGMNVVSAFFVLAAFLMALNFHCRIREIQKQNDALIGLLRKIELNTQTRSAP